MDDRTDPQDSAPKYVPPKVWEWKKSGGGRFAAINRPVAGATHDKALPVGRHPLQLYSLATPNGVKVTVLLEELLALGHAGAEYDAWLIKITEGDQFGSGFVAVNPNSKIPALLDRSTEPPTRVFESGSILLYLAEKTGQLLPSSAAERARTYEWLGVVSSDIGPAYSGQFVFNIIAPEKQAWAIDFYDRLCLRLLAPMETRLGASRFLAGDGYSIADVIAYPVAAVSMKRFPGGLDAHPNIARWAGEVGARPAVQRGMKIPR